MDLKTEQSMTLSKCTFLDPRFKHVPFMNVNQIKSTNLLTKKQKTYIQ